MRKSIAAVAIAALTLAGAPSASAFGFGSSGSSFLGSSDSPAESGSEKRIRAALVASYERTGFTLDPEIHRLAQEYVKAPESQRAGIQAELDALGVTMKTGGKYISNEEVLIDFFTIGEGLQLPPHGDRFGVGIHFGPSTTEAQVFIAE